MKEMTKDQIRESILKHGIPRGTVARLSRLYLCDLSGWLNGHKDISPERINTVAATVLNIERLIQHSPFPVDLSEPDNVSDAILKLDEILASQKKREALEVLAMAAE